MKKNDDTYRMTVAIHNKQNVIMSSYYKITHCTFGFTAFTTVFRQLPYTAFLTLSPAGNIKY